MRLLTFCVKCHGSVRESQQRESDSRVCILRQQIKEVSPFLLAPCRTLVMVAHLAIVQNSDELRDLREYEERRQIVHVKIGDLLFMRVNPKIKILLG